MPSRAYLAVVFKRSNNE